MATTKYSDNTGIIYPMRLSTARKAAAGTEPSGAITGFFEVKVSRSSKGFGLKPRGVKLSRPVAPAATDKIYYSFLPLRSETNASDPKYAKGATVAIGGVNWLVTGLVNESIR